MSMEKFVKQTETVAENFQKTGFFERTMVEHLILEKFVKQTIDLGKLGTALSEHIPKPQFCDFL